MKITVCSVLSPGPTPGGSVLSLGPTPGSCQQSLLAGMLALGLGDGLCRHQEECDRSVSITPGTTLSHPTQLGLPRVESTEGGPQLSGGGGRNLGLEVGAVSGWLFLKEGYN